MSRMRISTPYKLGGSWNAASIWVYGKKENGPCVTNGQRDFAAAVLLPHAAAAAAAAALQRQSAAVVLAAHAELLGTTVISGFKAAVCGSMAAPKHMQTLGSGSRQHSAAAKLALCSGSRGIFSGTMPYVAAPLQLSAALTNGNTAAI
ncbi:hypothetical protein B0H14DRAFT_2582065 [Mycena olivaceomarginata]|nr:hypothetical protein B0H14DRAFT_2582065 [Mycena olivaceomarginata]